jgi:hypothetical protein
MYKSLKIVVVFFALYSTENLFADSDTMLEVDILIKHGFNKNKDEILKKSKNLSESEKRYLYEENKTEKGLPAVLNLFFPGIGSIIQGDNLGSVCIFAYVAAMPLMIFYNPWLVALGLFPFQIFGIIRAITFPDQKNAELYKLLFGESKLTMTFLPFQDKSNFSKPDNNGAAIMFSYPF